MSEESDQLRALALRDIDRSLAIGGIISAFIRDATCQHARQIAESSTRYCVDCGRAWPLWATSKSS